MNVNPTPYVCARQGQGAGNPPQQAAKRVCSILKHVDGTQPKIRHQGSHLQRKAGQSESSSGTPKVCYARILTENLKNNQKHRNPRWIRALLVGKKVFRVIDIT